MFSALAFSQATPGALGPPFGPGGGTAQAQTVSFPQPWTLAIDQPWVGWLPAASNTAGGPTLTVTANSVATTTKSILKGSSTGLVALIANDIVIGVKAFAYYDGTQYVLQNPQTSSLPASWTGKVCPVAFGGASTASITCTPSGWSWTSGETLVVIVGLGATITSPTMTMAPSGSGTCTTPFNGTYSNWTICYAKLSVTTTAFTISTTGNMGFPLVFSNSCSGCAGSVGAAVNAHAAGTVTTLNLTYTSGILLSACGVYMSSAGPVMYGGMGLTNTNGSGGGAIFGTSTVCGVNNGNSGNTEAYGLVVQ